nr:nuclear transport factor 2 family protein [uncultured Allomuricauda sp.]
MKPIQLLPLYLIILTTIACQETVKSNKDDSDKKNSLLQTIETFNTAFSKGDLATLNSLTTENYIHTTGNSKAIGKSEWFKYLEKRTAQIQSGNLKVISYTLDEQHIEIYQDNAIVTGKISVVTQDSVLLKENQYRITNIWANVSGVWKRAAFHDGKIK